MVALHPHRLGQMAFHHRGANIQGFAIFPVESRGLSLSAFPNGHPVAHLVRFPVAGCLKDIFTSAIQ
jgi:hypothetical protein